MPYIISINNRSSTMYTVKTQADKVAALFGCTPEQARALYARNADQLQKMADKAHKTSRKVNGYTAQQLDASAAKYKGFAA